PQSLLTVAVSAAAGAAAARQAGLAPLLADIAQALLSPALPPRVRAAAAAVASLQTALGPDVSGATLRAALGQSGLFLEAQLARAAVTGAPAPPTDLKAALLILQQALRAWPEAAAPGAKAPGGAGRREPPPPPYRGGPASGQRAAAPTLTPHDDAGRTGSALLAETGAALARQELMQIASMPGGAEPQGARWMFEIPFATPQGAAVAQFEVSRDGARGGASGEQPPAWRARFAIDAEPMGPVQAQLVFYSEKAGVTLWAERAETAERLSARGQELKTALARSEFDADLIVRTGAPPGLAAPAGKFVDRAL